MPRLAIIADDLTGANDTGVQFRKYGLKTVVSLQTHPGEWIRDTDIVVVDTDSRALAAEQAAERVRRACRMFSSNAVGSFYKKVDSTLRGNLGAEIDAACEEFLPVITIIAPAFPKTGRTTVGGYQLLQGIPISLTEVGCDPKTPVHEAYIPKLLLEYGGTRLGQVPLHTVDEGAAAIASAMQELKKAGQTWIVCDAASENHLRHIIEAALQFKKILWVGSAGLAEQLAVVLNWTKNGAQVTEEMHCSSVVVAAGSVSETTRNQVLQYVEEAQAINLILDPVAAIRSPQAEGQRLSALAGPLLKEKNFVLSCDNERDLIEQAMKAGTISGLCANEVGEKIASAMGIAVSELVRMGADGLFLTGGETAISCCRELGATGLEICQEVVPGIPLSRLVGGLFHGLPIVTKAGAFGDCHAITVSVDTLKGRHSPEK